MKKMRKHPKEYSSWDHMKARCYNPKSENYKHYGGRGINVCDRWLKSFGNFYLDMGDCPSPGYSLDRKDNNGNYTPENCKWSTDEEQQRNRRDNVFLIYDGQRKTLSEWALVTGIPKKTISGRLSKGWATERVLNKN